MPLNSDIGITLFDFTEVDPMRQQILAKLTAEERQAIREGIFQDMQVDCAPLARAMVGLLDAALPQPNIKCGFGTPESTIWRLKSVDKELIALAWMMNFEGLRRNSLRRLAPIVGCTRAALSWHTVRIKDRFGLHVAGMKSDQAREAYARSQMGNVNRAGTGNR